MKLIKNVIVIDNLKDILPIQMAKANYVFMKTKRENIVKVLKDRDGIFINKKLKNPFSVAERFLMWIDRNIKNLFDLGLFILILLEITILVGVVKFLWNL